MVLIPEFFSETVPDVFINMCVTNYNEIPYGHKGGNYNKTNHTIHGSIGLMCPHCFKVYRRTLKYNSSSSIDIYGEKNAIKDNAHISVIHRTPSFNIDKCISCERKNVSLIEVDVNIVEAISIFNKKGFTTEFCCSGHDHGEIGYITFSSCDVLDYIHLLSPTWYHQDLSSMLNDYRVCKQEGIKINGMRITIYSDIWNFPESLIDILEFAHALPYLNK